MVDVTEKGDTDRTAVAAGTISMAPATLALIQSDGLPKGDVLAVARVAGIMSAKRTSELVPMCHPLPLTAVSVDFQIEAPGRLAVTASARTTGKTGVEMEALTAVAVAALTVYDMCKAVDRGMTIGDIRLLEKAGGRSGHWRAASP